MLVLRRITDAENDEFKRLVDLYREAFPEEERRDIEQLKVLLKEENSMFSMLSNMRVGWQVCWYIGILVLSIILSIWLCLQK